jgi:hypothetical protein
VRSRVIAQENQEKANRSACHVLRPIVWEKMIEQLLLVEKEEKIQLLIVKERVINLSW